MAGKVAIVTDSSACIPKEPVEKYDIKVVLMNIILGDKSYRDGIDMSPTEFYALPGRQRSFPPLRTRHRAFTLRPIVESA